jgi:hypothetical protein
MGRIVLYPYKLSCEGYALLRDTLREMVGEDRVLGAKSEGAYKPKNTDSIFGWGYSKSPLWGSAAVQAGALWFNRPERIANAVNKEVSFAKFAVKSVLAPAFTVSTHLAREWVEDGRLVVQRKVLKGSKGEGASVAHNLQEFIPNCKLYTILIPKTREFRVHVFNGKVIDTHEKIFKGTNPAEWEICSCQDEHDDSVWTWKRTGVVLPEPARIESVKAVAALGLDFGGVDVVTSKEGSAFILEVNTAPWLGTVNVKKYAKAVLEAAA